MQMHYSSILKMLIKLVLAILVVLPSIVSSSAPFDVRQHLSTATRYDYGKLRVEELLKEDVLIPPECRPVHLNLVSRHGTRAPTRKRIKQMNNYADRVRTLGASKHAPAWMKEWKSPWSGRTMGGELLLKGEEEMVQLAKRLRRRYEEIFKEPYHHDLYVIRSTQVARSAASAVAFGMGLFSGEGTLGPGQHRAFSVISDTRTIDKHLRFYENCQNYQESKTQGMVKVLSMQEDTHVKIAQSMQERFKFNITKDDIPIIWFICKQEAAALDVVDRMCSLFTVEEIELLEWADDLEVHTVKGYGHSLNYRMGIPLLLNLLESIERSIAANQGLPGTDIPYGVERANLRFAHAETVIPLTCLLGLFLNDEEAQKTRMELPLPPPSPPPQSRSWWGSATAPYAANTMVVLHKCAAPYTNTGTGGDNFFVQVIHNEKSVALPGCNGTHFCPFQMFKENVVLPHMDKTYESMCMLRKEPADCSLACQLLSLELWRHEHANFCLKGLEHLSPGYSVLDASRPWLCYWMLHSLAILGEQLDVSLEKRVVEFLSHCQDPEGGYCGGPGQLPHLATTYAAVFALVTIGGDEALGSINREKMLNFLLRMKDPCGGFRMHTNGEIDVRGCYTAIVVAYILNILSPALVDGVAEYISSCQSYEGGIGGEPGAEAHGGYTYCGVAALALINQPHRLDLASLVNWAVFRQGKIEGGFQGRINKLVDGCYSFWQGGIFPIFQRLPGHLNYPDEHIEEYTASVMTNSENSNTGAVSAASLFPAFKHAKFRHATCETDDESGSDDSCCELEECKWGPLFNPQALQAYILLCCQDLAGGLRDKPGKPRDYYHTCYCLSGLSVAQYSWSKTLNVLPLPSGVLGPYDNLLEPTHPLCNVVLDKYNHVRRYFSSPKQS